MGDDTSYETPVEIILERMRRAQTVAHVGSWEIDLRTNQMWGSEEAFRIYGLEMPPDQGLALAVVQQVPLPECRPTLDRALADLLAGRAPYDVEYEIRRPNDGERRVVHSLAEVSRGPDGVPTTVLGTLQDVTLRQDMERALRASEQRFRMILEHSADGIVLGDAEDRIVAVNEQMCRLTGYGREDLEGRSIGMLFSPAEIARAPLRVDLLDQGQAVISERMLLARDGTSIPVEMHSKKLPDGSYQSIYRDVRERRQLEEQLQLRQRMDSIGALSSGIAHDFNNILVSIIGYAELLRDEGHELSDSSREAVGHVLTASRRAADLVGRMQSLSQPERGHERDFDLHRVASETLQMLAQTTDRRIRMELAVEPGACIIRGHESDIYHVLVNLALNGVQAIEARGAADGDVVRIDAETCDIADGNARRLTPGHYVHVRVSDTGVGMSPAVKARAFDPLYTTKQKGVRKGQGLGLTMVYQIIVRGHQGSIDVETEEGRGTTFHLYLAAGNAEAPEAAEAAPDHRPEPRPGTILIVEDEPQIVDLMQRVLERGGHRVIVALDGAEGVDAFRRHAAEIDVVLLDWTLPKLNGIDVMREIVKLRPEVEIVLSSGDRLEIDGGGSRPVRLLPKPYSPADLAAVVRLAME